MPQPIAIRLRMKAATRGQTQAEAAAEMGVSLDTARKWFQGRCEPMGENLAAVNRYLEGEGK